MVHAGSIERPQSFDIRNVVLYSGSQEELAGV
jgi:hypothetical protein